MAHALAGVLHVVASRPLLASVQRDHADHEAKRIAATAPSAPPKEPQWKGQWRLLKYL